MEDSLLAFLIIFTVSVVTIAAVYVTKFSGNKQKKAPKTIIEENKETVVQTYANTVTVLTEQNDFLVQENKTIKKRLAAEIGVNIKSKQEEIATEKEKIEITSENLQEHYEIDVESGLKLVESLNLPLLENMDKSKIPALMNNPMVKNLVWKHIKENKDEMISLGVIIPKGQKQTETKEEPKEESGLMNLEFSNSNAKYMA